MSNRSRSHVRWAILLLSKIKPDFIGSYYILVCQVEHWSLIWVVKKLCVFFPAVPIHWSHPQKLTFESKVMKDFRSHEGFPKMVSLFQQAMFSFLSLLIFPGCRFNNGCQTNFYCPCPAKLKDLAPPTVMLKTFLPQDFRPGFLPSQKLSEGCWKMTRDCLL